LVPTHSQEEKPDRWRVDKGAGRELNRRGGGGAPEGLRYDDSPKLSVVDGFGAPNVEARGREQNRGVSADKRRRRGRELSSRGSRGRRGERATASDGESGILFEELGQGQVPRRRSSIPGGVES